MRTDYAVVVGNWSHGQVRLVPDQEEAIGLAQRTAQVNPGVSVKAVEVRVLADVLYQETVPLRLKELVEVRGREDWGAGEVVEVMGDARVAAVIWRRGDGSVAARLAAPFAHITRLGGQAEA